MNPKLERQFFTGVYMLFIASKRFFHRMYTNTILRPKMIYRVSGKKTERCE